MDWLMFIGLTVIGIAALIAFSLFVLLRPAARRLPLRYQIELEQGILRTLGSAIPALTAGATVLVAIYAFRFAKDGPANSAAWGAVFFLGTALATTFWFIIPLNRSVEICDPANPPSNFDTTRRTWLLTHLVHALLLMTGFCLFCLSVAVQQS
jgi:hypothetical protein